MPHLKEKRLLLSPPQVLCAMVVGLMLFSQIIFAQDSGEFIRQDLEKILVRDIELDPCSQCHQQSFQVWKDTPHATGFNEMHRKPRANTIRQKMGFDLIKRESLCVRCHYTANLENNTLKAVAGVSCESCHGAAREWELLHSDYGVAGSGKFGTKKDQETAAHREERLRAVREAGMLRPEGIYDVAANCFDCHTVLNERLVNIGGHAPGGSNFDLYNNINKIRHNFLSYFLYGNEKVNAEIPPERRRLFFIIGRALDLEYNLRGAAEATEEGVYLNNLVERSNLALDELTEINKRLTIPEIDVMIKAYKAVELRINNREALVRAAADIQEQARQIGKKYDGLKFDKIDKYMNNEADEVSLQANAEVLTDTPPDNLSEPADENQTIAASAAQIPENTYPRKNIRPVKKHAALGKNGCNCHNGGVEGYQNSFQWLEGNFHSKSLIPFNSRNKRVLEIATNYNISPASVTKGGVICMDCHGTVVRKNRIVKEAVSCESCHGPGKDFKNKHQDGKYQQGKEHGMVQLEDAAVRAAACAECHYITDERLLASGHPNGASFNFAEGNEKIQHWNNPNLQSGVLESAYAQVTGRRGAIPAVPVIDRYSAVLAVSASQPSGNSSGSDAAQVENVLDTFEKQITSVQDSRNRRIRSRLGRWPGNAVNVTLDPFEIDEKASIEEVLLILKQRIDAIYKKSGNR